VSPRERRSQERIGFRVPAHITVGKAREVHKGYLINLSASGAFIMMDRVVPLAGIIELYFHPRDGGECRARGKAAHVTSVGIGQSFGVVLDWSDDAFRKFVEGLAKASDRDLVDLLKDMRRIHIRVAADE